VFRQQLQSAIESRRIKFGNSKTQKPMKIDQHPFLANMLDAKGKTKVLTSEAAEKSASVDPQHRITTDDAKSKGLLGESGSSKKTSSTWHCDYSSAAAGRKVARGLALA
jgi:hypothetical protein